MPLDSAVLSACPMPEPRYSTNTMMCLRMLLRTSVDIRLAGPPPVPVVEHHAHVHDELYVVVSGRGVLVHDGKHDNFECGDLLFVAGGPQHRLESDTDELVVSVIHYGPHRDVPNG